MHDRLSSAQLAQSSLAFHVYRQMYRDNFINIILYLVTFLIFYLFLVSSKASLS